MRRKEQKQKREGWSTLPSTQMWVQMVANTRMVGKDHVALAEILANKIPSRSISISDYFGRIFRQVNQELMSWGGWVLDFSTQCRDVGFDTHEEGLKALHEVHTNK